MGVQHAQSSRRGAGKKEPAPAGSFIGATGWFARRKAIQRAPKGMLRANEKLVAYALSMHMNTDGGSGWPSEKTLADEAGLSVRTVGTAIRALDEKVPLIRPLPSSISATSKATPCSLTR